MHGRIPVYLLKNDQLTIALLDPMADVDRLGARYCTGGYIYQITDVRKGPLLAGPQYPAPRPAVMAGQGAPDMFMASLGGDTALVDGKVACIGVGQVRGSSPVKPFSVHYNREVIEYVRWEVDVEAESVAMRTEHTFGLWAYELVRPVTLQDRSVRSHTAIRNVGQVPVPIQ